MLLVKTIARPSSIHGLGCFASEPIAKGVVVWRFTLGVDHVVLDEVVKSLPEPGRTAVMRLGYLRRDGKGWISCGDEAAWMNFPMDPMRNPANLELGAHYSFAEPDLIAARDIAAGEELTVPIDSDGSYAWKLKLSDTWPGTKE